MNNKTKVLFAGEQHFLDQTEYKGFDSFNISSYEESGQYFISALENSNVEVDYIPTNKVSEKFPWTIDDLKKYDVIVLSDVGSNSFLVSKKTMNGEKTPNRLKLIKEYVNDGGGFIMWGGYMSFTGIHGYAFYKNTPIEEILPVNLMSTDDRVEVPEGFIPRIIKKNHPIFIGIPEKWEGWFLSYNRLIPKENSTILATIKEYNDDPFMVIREYGNGRTLASCVDCAPHGASPKFLNWKYSEKLYLNMVKWCAKKI